MSVQYPNMDESTDMHYALLQYDYPRTGDLNSLAPVPENPRIGVVAQAPRDLVEAQDYINIPDTDPDSIGPTSSLYRWPTLVSDSSYMMESSEVFSQPSLELTESDNVSSLFPELMIHHPSANSTPSCSRIHQARVTHYADTGQGCSSLWDEGSLASMNDSMWLEDPYSSFMLPENDERYFMNNMLDHSVNNTQRAVQSTAIPASMLMSEVPISMPLQVVHSSPSNDETSFYNELQHRTGHFPTEKIDEQPSLPRHQLVIPQLSITTSPSSQRRPRQLSLNEEVGFQSNVAEKRPQKQRRQAAKSGGRKDSDAIGNEKKIRRCGPLSAEKRRRRALVRAKTACSRCFASHLACSSEDPPCQNCLERASTLNAEVSCFNGSMQIYHDTLSPYFLNDFIPLAVKRARHSLKFIGHEIEVRLSTGDAHPPITLLACEYTSTSRSSLNATQDRDQVLKELPSLNYGIREESEFRIEAEVLQHINTVSSCSEVMGDKRSLSWKILSAICHFNQVDPVARQNSFLSTAISVNRLHYILGQSIIFDADTVLKTFQSLQIEVSTPIVTAKFLAAQLKQAMISLLNDRTKHLLYEYNNEVRRNSQKTWLVCLLTHLILTMCGELVEIQTDGFVPFVISQGNCNPEAIRRAGIELCRRIDHKILNHSWDLIRGKLRTLLQKRNPFIYGCEILMDEPGGELLSQSEQNVINEIRHVMKDDGKALMYNDEVSFKLKHELAKEITKKLSYPRSGGSSRTLEEHKDFREHNSGRLAAKYLRALEKKGKLES